MGGEICSARLEKGRERSVQRRHPWIFSGAICGESCDCESGDTVCVLSHRGEVLGYGTYSPDSKIRVRMLSFSPDATIDENFFAKRVEQSIARRVSLLAIGMTNAVRLINAENDALPGVVADYYAGHVVCQFTSTGAVRWQDAIVQALAQKVPEVKSVSERMDVAVRKKEGLPCDEKFRLLWGEEPPAEIEIFENGVKMLVNVREGHKTGYYLDQRDARRTVGEFANGRVVLNCFSYTGGFGLQAALGGAKKVINVDASELALRMAERNVELNFKPGSSACVFDYVEADVFKYLRNSRDCGRTFDMIVLDPPKFAESHSQLESAARGYKDINLLAMKLLAPNGILATFSCSGGIDADFFDKIVAEAAQDAHRDFQIIERTSQPIDHSVALSFPEGRYLKGLVLRAMPV